MWYVEPNFNGELIVVKREPDRTNFHNGEMTILDIQFAFPNSEKFFSLACKIAYWLSRGCWA